MEDVEAHEWCTAEPALLEGLRSPEAHQGAVGVDAGVVGEVEGYGFTAEFVRASVEVSFAGVCFVSVLHLR